MAAATPEHLREFADRLNVHLGLETGADGGPLLEADSAEEVAAAFDDVEVAIGDDGLSLGKGKVYVTTRRIIWMPSAAGAGSSSGGLALRYPQIVMHAVSNDTSSFSRPCVYLQLDEGSEAADEPMGVGTAARGGADEGEEGGSSSAEGEEGEEEMAAELRLVPADAVAVDAIFKAMCDCSALNPDTGTEDDGQAELFFDEAEVLAGLPAADRDAVLAARAEGALGMRDDIDELMQEDPDRFEDDEVEDEGEREERAGGEGAAAAAAPGQRLNGTAA